LQDFWRVAKRPLGSENAAEKRIHQRLRPWFSDTSGGRSEALPSHNPVFPPEAAVTFYAMTDQIARERLQSSSQTPWDDRALAAEVPVIVFANESSTPSVEILSNRAALRISTKDGRFIETWAPSSAEELEFLYRYGVHPEAEETHRGPLLANRYMARLAASVRTGILIAVDYGYTRTGTACRPPPRNSDGISSALCHPHPYEAPGEQDLTAHVNFTAPPRSSGTKWHASATSLTSHNS